MGLSSNTIIHFTSTKEALKGILSNNFNLKYCKETVKWSAKSTAQLHVPMVSFCDIPLSQIKDHISKYGHYGIGLSRKWALKNKLNPVLYVEPDSHLANSYQSILAHYAESPEIYNENAEVIDRIVDILRYVKNYEGLLTRSGKAKAKYRYSDEREWRFVPQYNSDCQMYYSEKAFNADGIKEEANQSLSKISLKFEPNDVKYIIIKSDNEISEFIEHLRIAKGNKYTQSDIERLTTRLLTTKQIHDDI